MANARVGPIVRRFAPALAALAAAGCGGDEITLPADVPARIEKVAGDEQSAAASTAVATAPAVKVTDRGGLPLAGVPVTFKVTGGGGTLAPTTPVPTDAGGVAAVASWTLGDTPGPNQLTATVSGSQVSGNPAVFTATAIVGNPNRLVFVVQPSNATIGQPITPAVQVQVQDAVGNPVSSATDKITVALGTNPGGATLAGTTSVNAVSGTATFSTLSLNKAGNGYTLTALGSGLVSATSAPFNVTNPPPTADNDAYSTNEDSPLSQPAPGVLAGDNDPNGDPLKAVLVTGPQHAASFTLAQNGSFTYTPAANFNGSDSFTYAANDGASNSNTATVNITVNPVNDAPSFTAGANQSTTALQSVTVPGWATNISPGPNEAGQVVTFTVTNDNNGAFVQQPAIDGSGTLTYQTSIVLTTVNVTVVAHDNGGTANGGVDTSAGQTFTITINP